jgi:hypothetical protein
VYYARLTALSADNPTTGLFEWAPDLYLYASLLQAAPYLRDDARVPIWLAAYDTLVQQLIAADSAADYPSGLTIQTEGTVY